MKKKICIITVILIAALFFAGCDSEVEYMVLERAESTDYIFQVRLSGEEMSLLNGSAQQSGVKRPNNWAWTVEEYLNALFALEGFARDAEYEKKPPAGSVVFAFRQSVPYDGDGDVEEDPGVSIERVSGNPFLYTYEYRAPNPFNTFRAEYDNPQKSSAFDVFVNGNSAASIPAFTAAFPVAKDNPLFDPGNLTVKFTMVSLARYNVPDGAQKREDAAGYYYYTFPAKFTRDNEITFQFIRPNATGWYLTAILAGALAAGFIFLISKNRKVKRQDAAEPTPPTQAYPPGYYPPNYYYPNYYPQNPPPKDPFG